LSIRDILFHLEPNDMARAASEFAISLAEATGAHLTAAGVVIDYLPTATDYGFAAGWDLMSSEMFAQISDQNRKDTKRAYERFMTIVPAGVQTEFVMIETLNEIALGQFGRLARHFDLSVVSQSAAEGAFANQIIIAALFGSGRPVFIIPSDYKSPAKLEKVMLCWNEGIQAARALADSLPLLTRARNVEIVCVGGSEGADKRLAGYNITRHLSRHGIIATLRELPAADDIASALLSYAEESAADYIVMGAYGHWRLRELIFGGTTQSMLNAIKIPLFMSH